MIITSAVRKLLLGLGYPRLEKSGNNLIGPHQSIGATQVRIPSSVNCQIFYPAVEDNETSKKSSKCIPYWRPEALQGLVEYLGLGDGLLQLLCERKHPCAINAEPLITTHDFPLVLCSHGLAGTFEMYTELCRQMASLGYCVVALEHEDGSAAYAEREDSSKSIPYERPNDEPYSRQKVLKLRTPMLRQRVEELQKVVEYFGKEKEQYNKSDDKASSLLSKIVDVTDPSQLHLVGHSFGGATQMLATQQWTDSDRIDSMLVHPKSLTVLDAWAFALEEKVVQQGLSKMQRSNIDKLSFLSVISEDWATTNSERQQIIDFLENSVSNESLDIHSYYAKHSVHQSFSDSEAWFPSFVAKKLRNRGKREERHATIRAVIEAWEKMVSGKDDIIDDGNADAAILQPFSFQSEGEKHPTLLQTEATASTIISA